MKQLQNTVRCYPNTTAFVVAAILIVAFLTGLMESL